MDMSVVLPEECLSKIISLTTPRDACKVSVVSPVFRSAADSDAVWEKLLPSDYREIVSGSSSSQVLSSLSKKDTYFHLSHNPVLIKNGTMSFALEKERGKKCYMVGVRRLYITWGGQASQQMWRCRPESRFLEVAEAMFVWWIGINVKIQTKILSPMTNYGAYIVFKFPVFSDGFLRGPVQFSVFFEGRDSEKHTVFLDPCRNWADPSQDRGDGWMEIEIDEFFTENGDDQRVKWCVFDFLGFNDSGVVIEGVEIRPKIGHSLSHTNFMKNMSLLA